jgi:hypothetical protein
MNAFQLNVHAILTLSDAGAVSVVQFVGCGVLTTVVTKCPVFWAVLHDAKHVASTKQSLLLSL